MKRTLAILVFLALAMSAFAVSGQMTIRYGLMPDWSDAALDTQDPLSFATGWMFQYWGNDGRNAVDLWEGKECTGFDLNFDKVGISYKTRATMILPFGLFTNGYVNDRKDDSCLRATSPGYVQFRDVKAGPVSFSAGFAWWQTFAERSTKTILSNTGAISTDQYTNTIFNRFYFDFKFNTTIGDVVIKQYDWEMMHFDVQIGSSGHGTNGGILGSGGVTNTDVDGKSFVAFIPLHVLFPYDLGFIAGSIDFSPMAVLVGEFTETGKATKVNVSDLKQKYGATFDISMQIPDFNLFKIYFQPGFFWEDEVYYKNTGTTTNSWKHTSSMVVPLYLGLKFKLGPGIESTIGWGYNIRYKNITGMSTTNDYWEIQPRSGYYAPGYYGDVMSGDNNNYMKNKAFALGGAELAYYGDNFMDLAFVRFTGEAKFGGGNWTLGIAGGVALNDNWTFNWISKNQQPYYTQINSISTTSAYATQLFSFMNFANYDRNAYIKYEDEAVAIKFIFLSERSFFQTYQFDADSQSWQTGQASALMGLFESVSLTYKF